jgi:DNA polymerase III epsilon subunit-like protein
MREIVLDTETTGLDPLDGRRVVEIGAVELINTAGAKCDDLRAALGRADQQRADPGRRLDQRDYANQPNHGAVVV